MIIEFVLFLIGISGFFSLYMVLAHLSAHMGEGLRLPEFYRLYFAAILIIIYVIPYGWSIHYLGENGSEDILFILLTIGNIIAVIASYKYWWWLKDEFLKTNNRRMGR